MKKKAIYSLMLSAAVLLLAACVQEEDPNNPTKGQGRTLTVNYSFDEPLTRVVATGTERQVNDVAILFYKADNANVNNEVYVAHQQVAIPSGSSAGSFPLPLPDEIIEGNQYKLVLIGNFNAYAPQGKTFEEYAQANTGFTCTQMRQQIYAMLETGERVTTPLPYYGRLLGANGEETTLTGPAEAATSLGVSVRFSRAVARFDLINLAAGKLKIEWVKVCNYRDQGYYYHENMTTGTIARGTAIEDPANLFAGYVAAPAPIDMGGGAWRQNLNTGGLYAFPNAVAYTSQNDNRTTFLLVAGRYKANPTDPDYSSTVTYYRVNASLNGASQMLQRNYIYTIAVNNVKGPGASTEEEAANEEDKLLDYIIDDEWDDNTGGTVVDPDGNYLTLSRSNIVLPGVAGSSELIKIAVRPGTGWEIVWEENLESAFTYQRVNDTSFTITAVGNNATPFTKNARLMVRVTGVTSDLKMPVSVVQLSNTTDPVLLMVDGQMGNISYTIPGQGGSLRLPVVTGSASASWTATANNNLNQFVSYFSPSGGNNGVLVIDFPANVSPERSGTLTVKRTGAPDVVITLTQTKSPYTINILPANILTDGITVDAFDGTTGVTTNVTLQNNVVKNIQFQVMLADPTLTFTATSSFNQTSDAFVTLGNKDITKMGGFLQSNNAANASAVTGTSANNTVWLNVFRAGPGDKDIDRTITIQAKRGSTVVETITIPVKIWSSCKIGDSKILTFTVADRNVGATPRGEGGAAVGLYYTTYNGNDDKANTGFRGTTHTFAEAQTMCSTFGETNNYETSGMRTGWKLPTQVQMQSIIDNICVSKSRVFIVSSTKVNGETIGCWLPDAMGSNNVMLAQYWTSSSNHYTGWWSGMGGSGFTMTVNSCDSSTLVSVRCIR